MKRILLVSILLILMPAITWAQEENKSRLRTPSSYILTLKPQHFILGLNVGLDYQLSQKWSVGSEVTSHFWFEAPSSIAVSPHVKYYFSGQFGRGWYARARLVGGYFFEEPRLNEPWPFYGGGGIGLGGIANLRKYPRFHLFFDVGYNIVAPFGHKAPDPEKILPGSSDFIYYTIVSPAAAPEIAIGIGFRL